MVLKLNTAEAEAAETQVWLSFARDCEYLNPAEAKKLIEEYENVIGKLITMENQSEKWNPLNR